MIRFACEKDIPDILELLEQILHIHYVGRPDLFKGEGGKFNDQELAQIMANPKTPIFVYEENGKVLGHCFCDVKITSEQNNLKGQKVLFIHDLCVYENCRGRRIGQQLFERAKSFAKEQGLDRIELNVWEFNSRAKDFYQKMGMHPQRTILEQKLD